MEALVNWLKDADKHESRRGTIYTGPAPYTFNNNKSDESYRALFAAPWVISHPDARDQLFKAKGIECFCIPTISVGTPIGVLVEPWSDV